MRLRRFELLRYGHFTDHAIDFGDGAKDLHLIIGPNEAGKSTMLNGLGDLLFGIATNSTYGFKHDYQAMRLGGVVENPSGQLAFLRRKGNRNTLLNMAEDPIANDALAPFTGGADRALFERMFGLDHIRLREGGQAILEAKDDVGKMLFEASSGIANLGDELRRLDEAAEAIFRPRGSKQHFTLALSDYAAAATAARNAAHSAKDWKALTGALADVGVEKQQLTTEMRASVAETAQLERIRRAKPQFLRLDQIQADLSAFGDLPPLPDDFEVQVRQTAEALSAAQGSARGARENLERLKVARQAIIVDTAILAQGEHKETLITLQDRASTANLDIPRRNAEFQEMVGAAKAEMARIGLGGEPVGFDQTKLPTNPEIVHARADVGAYRNIQTRLEAAQTARTDAATALRRVEDRIVSLGAIANTSALRRVVTQQEQHKGIEATVTDRRRNLADLEDRLLRHLPTLALNRGDAEALANRVFPTMEQVAGMREECAAFERRREDQERLMRELGAELSEAQGALARLEADYALPSTDDLAAARRSRNETWQLIKQRIEAGQLPDAPSLRNMDTGLEQADRLVDKMAGAAARYEEMGGQSRRIARDNDKLAEHDRQHGEILQLIEGWQQRWQDLWQASGIEAPDLDAAQNILDHRSGALDMLAEVGREQRTLSDLEQTIADGRQQILSELNRDKCAPGGEYEDMTLSELLHEASEISAVAVEQQIALKTLMAQKEDAVATLRDGEKAVTDWQTRKIAALAAWQHDTAIENAEAVFGPIENLRAKLGEIDGLQHRVNSMESDVQAFDALAHELSQTFGLGDVAGTPMEIATAITAKFNLATADRTKAELMDREIAQADTACNEAGHDVQVCTEAMAGLCRTAKVERHDQIAAVISRCAAASTLQSSVIEINEALANDGDGIDMGALRQQCNDTDPDQIPGRLREIEQARPGLDARLEDVIRRERDLQQQVDEIRQAQGAADPEQEAAQKLVVVVEEAERYLRLKTSARLLRWAIEQHRKEMQGPLLTRASVLFQTLTVGRYTRLFPDFDDGDHARLMGENSNGDSLLIERMSDGTRDQLYLALRLAAVEHYGENAAATLLPFVADDLLINFDDARTAAGFQALAELSKTVQVIVFTHHQHLSGIAQKAVGEDGLTVHRLD